MSQPASQQSPSDRASNSDSTFSTPTAGGKRRPTTDARSRWKQMVDNLKTRLSFETDYRARIHPHVARFLGFREELRGADHEPLPFPPFSWLQKIPLRYEIWILATIGSFVSILLIEAIMSSSTAFRDVYGSPLIISSFGASAVLVFGVTEAPLAQPRNAVLGQVVPTLVAIAITRLWLMGNPDYANHLPNQEFYAPSFVNGALCMSSALLVQLALGIVHPPGGATALAVATEPAIIALGWHCVPVVLASALIMLGWALLVNNVGRKRYPMYWWAPGKTFVVGIEQDLRDLEAGEKGGTSQRDVDAEALAEDLAMTETERRRSSNF